MKMKVPQFAFIILLTAAGFLTHCGGGTSDQSTKKVNENFFTPSESPAPDADLSQMAKNSFPGKIIRTTPEFIDFPVTLQKKPLLEKVTLTNGSEKKQVLTFNFFGSAGGFSLLEENGSITASKILELEAGVTQELRVRFDAALVGVYTGYLEITASRLEGSIYFPLRARVSHAKNIRIIPSDYLCASQNTPLVERIDFMRVPTAVTVKRNIKICNTGSNDLKIDSITFIEEANAIPSVALESNAFEDFTWAVTQTLNTTFFPYYNPETTQAFYEPETVPYTGPPPSVPFAFKAVARIGQRESAANNLLIQAGGYAMIEVSFKPNIYQEAEGSKLFDPIPYTASMKINTSVGPFSVAIVGATGGFEPILKIVPSSVGGNPDSCDSSHEMDLRSPLAALYFDAATIYKDWIPEDTKTISLRLCNGGGGTKPLMVWADPIESGFFTFKEESPRKTFPLLIPAGSSEVLPILYAPTPSNQNASSFFDLGQLVFTHTGGNGPLQKLTLMGEQESGEAVKLVFEGTNLVQHNPSNPRYDDSKRKSLQCVQKISESNNTGKTEKDFLIKNLSKKETLTSKIILHPLIIKDGKRGIASAKLVGATNTQTMITNPNSDSHFKIEFNLDNTIEPQTVLLGRLQIINHFNLETESRTGKKAPDYDIYYSATVSNSDQCSASTSSPLDGTVTMVIDRITMVLFGLPEPARNPPAFKFHLPIDLDKENKTARLHGLPFDPTKSVSPVKLIRSYAHQISNINQCFPLPTNPYKLEFEEGSWDDPQTQCPYEAFQVTGREVCMPNNGTQKFTDPTTNQKFNVFYHEFVKFNPDCSIAIEGKIATFAFPENKTAKDIFDQMFREVGPNGKEADYARLTRAYSLGSYIDFKVPYSAGECNKSGRVTDADEIRKCWESFKSNSDMRRAFGMVEECSYFQFEIDQGCVPQDAPGADKFNATVKCTDPNIQYAKPETWQGFGKYEVDPNDDTKYHLTLRNVRIRAYAFVHSLNSFFGHEGKLLYSDLAVTLTTKAIGRTYGNNVWNDLIAEGTKNDFQRQDVEFIPQSDTAKQSWVEDNVNNQFTTGENGEFDDVPCDLRDSAGDQEHCRGNFQIYQHKLYHAGEPISLEHGNRLIIVGLGAFHGKGELAPSFAKESAGGQGKALYFTFHGCLIKNEVENGQIKDLDEKAGCYDPKLDDVRREGNPVVDEYVSHGLLTPQDLQEDNKNSKARINFRIFDEDRNRLTDYYRRGGAFKFDNNSRVSDNCGYGM